MPNTTKEQRREEAIARLKMLHLHPNVLKDFKRKEPLLNKSEFLGALYWLDEDDMQIVRRLEEQYNATVYFAIFTPTHFGDCLSLLYVSDYTEEWERDRADLKEGYPLVWVENLTAPYCSEFGSIGIREMFGGLVRTA